MVKVFTPPVQLVILRYTVNKRVLYFKATFYLCCFRTKNLTHTPTQVLFFFFFPSFLFCFREIQHNVRAAPA